MAFKFTTYVGKDDQGKQKYKTTTWKPPNGLSVAKARKPAEAEAYRWEQEINGNQPEHGEFATPTPIPCEARKVLQEVSEEETFRLIHPHTYSIRTHAFDIICNILYTQENPQHSVYSIARQVLEILRDLSLRQCSANPNTSSGGAL